jgi:pyruvyl transferase EpsO
MDEDILNKRPQTLDELCDLAASSIEHHIRSTVGVDDLAIVGYCCHSNVGDCAIARGEDRLLSKLGASVLRIGDDRSADSVRGPVLLPGGGNIGDLYPWVHAQREQILSADPGRPVLQLPQTIHFSDPANSDRFRKVVARHRSFTLLVRDLPSLEWAQRNLDCRVHLVPDCAFLLGLMKRRRPSVESLALLRADREAIAPSAPAHDWVVEPRVWHAPRLWPRVVRKRWRPRGRVDDFLMQRLAQRRLERGLALLGSARNVVTDRLHAVILCALMGVDVVATNNSYGKVFAVIETWRLDELAGVSMAPSHRSCID